MESGIQVEAYTTVASAAILFWDVLLHGPQDFRLMRTYGLRFSQFVYCFSRLTTIFYMLGLCIIETYPVGDCNWIRYVAYIYPFTVPITILLFLFRIHAIFRNRSYVLVFVFLSWLLVLSSAIVVAIRTEGTSIDGTGFCTKKMDERDISGFVSTLTRFGHDTLVFIVTSCWLFRSNLQDDRIRFTSLMFGNHLRPFARSLLQDGQAYYLATLVLNVVVIVLTLLPKPFVTPCTLGGPLFVLISNMACHVYRNLLNAKYRDHCEFLHQWVGGEWRRDGIETGMEMNNRRPANV